ncbi:MAG: RNA-binding protein [Nitrososphaerota archaeon]|nr:RNA-binding protein [Aigarchaeota archaeon]MDW8077034.1 RNA-binding protein [Nitrososphaerota archaeon]
MSQTIRPSLILVGSKPAIRYVTACITLFNRGSELVVLRARGKNINNCLETVRLLRNGFLKNLKIVDVRIGSDEYETPNGQKRFVSYIEIFLNKG